MDLQPAQKITYQNKYDVCGKCVSRGETMLMAAGILSLLFALPFFSGIPDWMFKGLTWLNVLCIVGQFLLLTVSEVFLYPDAEADRVKGLFDHALGTRLLEKPVEGYYTNAVVPYGVRKMLVNGFENSFFTYSIARKMTPGLITKNGLFFVLFITVAVVGLPVNGWISLIQIFASQAFLLILLKHLFFTTCVRKAFEGFKLAFSEPSIPDAYALFALISYEKALAGYASLLDSKIHKKHNDRLSGEWEEMKKRYNIGLEKPSDDPQGKAE